MNEPEKAKQHWDSRVQAILKSVRRRGTILMLLGYAVYGIGSILMLTFIKDKQVATVSVMFFFQLMVIYFGTKEMFPSIQGAFRVGIEANRDSVPMFESVAQGIQRLESDPANHPLVKQIEERIERLVKEKVEPVVNTWARIGERLEKVTIPQFEKMVAQCGDTEKKLDSKVSSTMEGVKRVSQQIEGELSTGLIREVREAAEAVKMLGMQHAAPPMPSVGAAVGGAPVPGRPVKPAAGRDFSGILSSLNKKENGAAVPAASQGGRS